MKKFIISISLAAFALAVFFNETAQKAESNENIIIENAQAVAGEPEEVAATCWGSGTCKITNEVAWKTIYVTVDSKER